MERLHKLFIYRKKLVRPIYRTIIEMDGYHYLCDVCSSYHDIGI